MRRQGGWADDAKDKRKGYRVFYFLHRQCVLYYFVLKKN